MSTNHTPNYQLSQWEPSDQFSRTEFNADNAKLDAALTGLSAQIAEKAAASALAALSDQVADNAAQHTGFGNCHIAYGTYDGTGTYGSETPNRLSFGFQPKLVVIQAQRFASMDIGTNAQWGHAMLVLVRPLELFNHYSANYKTMISWSQNGLSWYSPDRATWQMNASGLRYSYVALG